MSFSNISFNKASRLRFWLLVILVGGFISNSKNPNFNPNTTYIIMEGVVAIFMIHTLFARAKDAGVSLWWGLAMFVPLLNIFAFFYLGLKPSKIN